MRISDWSSDVCSSDLDRELGLTVYIGQCKGHATTGDWSDAGIAQAVDAALAIAGATGEDPCNGLADAALMAGPAGDLDLDHPWAIDADAAVDLARACEAAAFAADPRITGSEGAGVSSHRGISRSEEQTSELQSLKS